MNDQGIESLPFPVSLMTLENSLTIPGPQAPLRKAGSAILFIQVTCALPGTSWAHRACLLVPSFYWSRGRRRTMLTHPRVLGVQGRLSRGGGTRSEEGRRSRQKAQPSRMLRGSLYLGTRVLPALQRSAAHLAGPPGGRCGAPQTGRLRCMGHSARWPRRSWAWLGLLPGLPHSTHCWATALYALRSGRGQARLGVVRRVELEDPPYHRPPHPHPAVPGVMGESEEFPSWMPAPPTVRPLLGAKRCGGGQRWFASVTLIVR